MKPALVHRVVACALLLVVVATALSTSRGGALFPLWLASGALLAFALRSRVSAPLAIALSVSAVFAVELVALRLSPVIPGSIESEEIVRWLLISAVCWAACVVRPVWAVPPSRHEASAVVSASAGTVLLLAVAALSQVKPGANALAWAMRGDSVNVITIARQIYRDGGIAGGRFQGPTPLPFAIITANFSPGRSGLAEGELLAHDVAGYAQVWVLVMALCCLLAGLSVVAAAPRRWTTSALAGFASLFPLSWYYLGIQFQYGFENTTVAVVLLTTAWIIVLAARSHPLLAIAGLLVTGTSLLAVWSPMVLAIGALLVVSVEGFVPAWRRSRWPAKWGVLASLTLFTGYALLVTVPDFFQNADFLRRPGAFPAVTLATVTVIGGVTAVTIAWARRWRAEGSGSRHVSGLHVGASALLVALVVGTGYFIFQRRSEVSLWGYYPQKYSYTLSLLIIVVFIGLVAAGVSEARRSRRFTAFVVVSTVVTSVGLVGLAQSDDPRRLAAFPLWSMTNGTMFRTSEDLATIVLASSGRADGLDMAWRLPDPYSDNLINFWWLQIDLPDPNDHEARLYSQRELPREPEDVCDVIRGLGEPMTVHTADPTAEALLADTCGDLDWTVHLEADQRSLYTGP